MLDLDLNCSNQSEINVQMFRIKYLTIGLFQRKKKRYFMSYNRLQFNKRCHQQHAHVLQEMSSHIAQNDD